MSDNGETWERTGTVATISSPCVTMYCERWRDSAGADLEYWRVERPNSIIVLPLRAGQILLPAPMFRPGVGRATLDLPGGRLTGDLSPEEAAVSILKRELGVAPDVIHDITPLNPDGWLVNSSFNNQLLFGLVATIGRGADMPPAAYATYAADRAGLRRLLADLTCLQCRAVVQEYLLQLELEWPNVS